MAELSNKNFAVQQKEGNVFPSDLVLKLLEGLNSRTKNIIIKRFGLDGQEKQTLEQIGRQYGITRERVRQIQSAALREFKKSQKIKYLEPLEEQLKSLLQKNGHAMEYQNLVKSFKEKINDPKLHGNHLEFALTLSPHFENVSENETNRRGWKTKNVSKDIPEKVIQIFCDILQKEKKPLPEDHAVTVVLNHNQVKNLSEEAKTREAILSYFNLSKKVLKNPFGEWGLTLWSEILPRGVKDKAYLVLKKAGKPLHFREITNLINEKGFSKRPANAQTVHNELIKDKRFVLVGRGMYALVEWGYRPGTVIDVVSAVLKEAKTALGREEIVKKVLKQRKVKKNTIILALQNKEKFERVGEGMYKLAE
ncbi:MAG: sigma factor-like helix-turn-helix DNA-binding protein [Patescibacteria group bacterium]